MKRFLVAVLMTVCCLAGKIAAQERLPEYIQAEKFTQDKLNTMLFSTMVDPHWFGQDGSFWYEYKTSEGTFWYVVNPAAKTKKPLFDRDEMASQLTEIVHDPYEARHLPIRNLKAKDDGRTFTFEVTSTKDAPKEKGKKAKKEVFYFSYDYPTQKLTHLKDQEEEPKRLRWGSVSPDKKTVIYAKDLNLYRMSYEDYLKAKKDEKDSTIVEIQLTDDGMEDFGRRIKGFNGEEALVIGLESRTSSPVRIPRGEDMQSTIRGLYPCGEGAGYAGGIMSAAMDGMKTAEAIRKKYSPMAEQAGTD